MEEELFPSTFSKILSDLSCFPNLENLIIEFPFNNSEWRDAFYLFDSEESSDEVVEQEKRYGWRAMMAKFFNAVVQK
jgi:hypothetical protein